MGINIVSLVFVFYSHIYRYTEELYYDLFPPPLNPYFYSHTNSVTAPALSTLSYIYIHIPANMKPLINILLIIARKKCKLKKDYQTDPGHCDT